MESSEGLTASLAPRAPNNGDAVLSMAMAEFGESFEFCEGVHIVDTRMPQSKGMRGLRSLLGSLKGQVLKVCVECESFSTLGLVFAYTVYI